MFGARSGRPVLPDVPIERSIIKIGAEAYRSPVMRPIRSHTPGPAYPLGNLSTGSIYLRSSMPMKSRPTASVSAPPAATKGPDDVLFQASDLPLGRQKRIRFLRPVGDS